MPTKSKVAGPAKPKSASKGKGTAPKDSPATTVVTKPTKGNATMSDQVTIIDLDMNLEDFEDYEILPDGPLPGECTIAEVRTSDNGNQYFYTMWRIDPSDYPLDYDRENAPNGTIMNYSRVQVPTPGDRRSITSVKKFMAAMGLSLKTNSIDCSQWVGKRAMLNIGHQVYNGENRNQIVSVENEDA